jgi:GNAT superfamily N-acetyltransferase
MTYTSKSLKSELWEDFQSYFEFDGSCSGCWCMNHRLPIGLDFEGEGAKLAMKELVQSNRVFGVLAYVEGDSIPVGWLALDRRKTLPGHDCIGEDINCDKSEWSIHCVTSRKDYKNKGVESYLIDEAIELAKSLNAKVLESYPEPESSENKPFKTWNTFNGHESHYAKNGFVKTEKSNTEIDEFFSVMKKNM